MFANNATSTTGMTPTSKSVSGSSSATNCRSVLAEYHQSWISTSQLPYDLLQISQVSCGCLSFPFRIELSLIPGHDDRAWHVAWNPSKPLLASCSSDKTVRLYNYRIGTSSPSDPPQEDGSIKTLTFSHNTTIPTGHTKTVRAVAWSPSGKTLATASFDSNIGIWAQDEDEDERGEWECMSLLEGHETECKSVAYSSSGTLLASCSRDKTVWIWEGAL